MKKRLVSLLQLGIGIGLIVFLFSRMDNRADLIEALRAGRLLGAGLDVVEGEREKVHDFSGLNVVTTTHIGWFTREAVRRIVTIALDDIRAFLKGELIHVVNRDFLERKGGSRDGT